MDYFSLLNLQCEPFSNSPDPDFFYRSDQHTSCLQQLELAIRLRRGLNVVTGEVGTGKTTLCRELIRSFDGEEKVDTYLLLDPGWKSESPFLTAVLEQFSEQVPPEEWTAERKKEAIKQSLFEKGVEKDRIAVLIIDEGQKIAAPCLEILREFLNYETNAYKLLQIVIFAQKEFEDTIAAHPNFADRINLRLDLNPLGIRDTIALIRYRIQVSGGQSARRFFSIPAMTAIYLATRGYPRRIIHLCHRILLALIIQNRGRAGWRLVRASARRSAFSRPSLPGRWLVATAALALALTLVMGPRGWFSKHLILSSPVPAVGAAPTVSKPGIEPMPQITTFAENFALGDETHFPEETLASRMPKASGPLLSATDRSYTLAGMQPAETVTTPMPARLGRLAVAPNETLGQMIQTIYGRFTPARLEAVVKTNPHIPDPNRLNVGDVIHFPAVPVPVRPLPVEAWWVQLAVYPQLGDAVRGLKSLAREGTAARLVPYWNPDQGLVFSLVLAECYYDRQAAEKVRDHIPPVTAQSVQVQSIWRDDTVFFSDPFQTVAGITENHLQAKRGRRAR